MKRVSVFKRVISFMVLGLLSLPAGAIELHSSSAVLYELEGDRVLYSKNSEAPIAPANLTKLMSALVAVEAIRNEEIALTTPFKISEHAWRTGGAPARVTTMFANPRSNVEVQHLVRGLVVHSANDAAIALAEGIAGDEPNYATRMTQAAQRIGMDNTTFANATGYPHKYNRTTVADMVLLANHIYRKEPGLFALFGEEKFKWNKITQRNKNPLLRKIEGLDGFGAGYSDEHGFSAIATLIHGNKRYIAAIAGAQTIEEREADMKTLLVQAFTTHAVVPLYEKGERVGYAAVYGGDEQQIALVAPDTISALLNPAEKKNYSLRINYRGPLNAPVKPGLKVGELEVVSKNDVIYRAPLVTGEAVGTGSLKQRSWDALGELVWKVF
ncbi:D-alanyl-D-alanine carboxypeptidase [Rhodobacteraceae bacterium RKSG542]|uniref:D-alanyl-D-alanine carboxypeptidase family protein n=1 Tax=Pseudovibrio flavus TaxID=2529854 RepID=UPI0012BCC20A|nr:D-alanyl-D-alanine carboxypeptidase family protein [Pseudovibrio flavus]MTI17455.1 D-alanyl-D-alanine carboxypeptidase [Pseudovibrio flavus]